MKPYLIRYYFEWANGTARHGVMRPRGILISGKIVDRNFWYFAEAKEIVTRLDDIYGAGSHWIIRENDA